MEDSFKRERNSSGVSDRSIRRKGLAASVPDANERENSGDEKWIRSETRKTETDGKEKST